MNDIVAHYAFEEGSGTQAKDSSGNGNDGAIHGAEFVESPTGHALRFDGMDDFVDCGVVRNLQIDRAGTVALWCKPVAFQGGLICWSSGTRWHDQRFVIGFNTVGPPPYKFAIAPAAAATPAAPDGWGTPLVHVASDGLAIDKHYRVYDLEMPVRDCWNHLALMFDGSTVAFYLDGRLLCMHDASFARPDLEGIPLWIGRCQGLGEAFFQGLVDEVRVHNRALSSEQILAYFKDGAAAYGKDTSVFDRPQIQVDVLSEPGWIAVDADYSLMRPLPEGAGVEVQLLDAEGTATPIGRTVSIDPAAPALQVVLDASDLTPGDYTTRTAVIVAGGAPIGRSVESRVLWPGRCESFRGIRILNNLVWELLRTEQDTVDGNRAYAFRSPKPRWVHVTAAVASSGGGLEISLDGGHELLSFEAGEGAPKQGMRFLPAGDHELTLRCRGVCRIETLVIRSIPEIMFHTLIGEPFIRTAMPAEQFVERHVLPHVNTIAVSPDHLDHPFLRKWQARESRYRWLVVLMLDFIKDPVPPPVGQVVEHLATSPGMVSPLADGAIGDEFQASSQANEAYADAIRKVHATPEFAEKPFYGWITPARFYAKEDCRKLLRAIVETGGVIAWERYLKMQLTESRAREYVRQEFGQTARKYEQACRHFVEHMVVCSGLFMRPGRLHLNSTPTVDFKAYLDMQFETVANDPALWGTRGLMAFTIGHGDEETIRWMIHLFRHYGIEGRTERATSDPYLPTHIRNGDFLDDTEGWTLEPAEAGSIRRVVRRGLGFLEVRVSRIEGDTVLVTVRSAARPNVIRQAISDLQPGRLYSLRLYTADHRDMSKEQEHAVAIEIENATVLPDRTETLVCGNWGGAAGGYPPYMESDSAWLNYHWRVFRADGDSAQLVISDWLGDAEPGGPIGQEIMYNFISVQPYFSEN
jgi:hypothetical protein